MTKKKKAKARIRTIKLTHSQGFYRDANSDGIICTQILRRVMRIPSRTEIWVTISDQPIRNGYRAHWDGASVTIDNRRHITAFDADTYIRSIIRRNSYFYFKIEYEV